MSLLKRSRGSKVLDTKMGIRPDLGYAVTKSYGIRRRLLTPASMRSLVFARDLADFARLLLDTTYREDILKVVGRGVDASELERVFDKKLIDRCAEIGKAAPRKIADFLEAYFRKFEVLNIKRILRGKVSRLPVERIRDTLFPVRQFSPINFDALLEAENLERVMEALDGTIYGPAGYGPYGLDLIEARLDKIYMEKVLKPTISNVPRGDRGVVERAIDVVFGVPNLVEIGITVHERKHLYDLVRKAREKRRHGFASIWDYIISCEIENRELVSIAWGKQNQMKPERILERTVISTEG